MQIISILFTICILFVTLRDISAMRLSPFILEQKPSFRCFPHNRITWFNEGFTNTVTIKIIPPSKLRKEDKREISIRIYVCIYAYERIRQWPVTDIVFEVLYSGWNLVQWLMSRNHDLTWVLYNGRRLVQWLTYRNRDWC